MMEKRWNIRRCALLLALACILSGTTHAAIRSVPVVTGLSRPVFVTSPPGDTQRLFIIEQHTGKILIVKNGTLLGTPFLTVPGLTTGSEQGLLGLAFHPNYATNGKFYVYYTTTGGGPAGQSILAEYEVSASDPDVADTASARTILHFDQPQSNHNAGWIAFGPNDGYLYVASGDGGGGGDDDSGHTPGVGNGQDITNNLLGKLLRIDIDGDDFPGDATLNYAIPASNPLVGVTGDDEIWAYGLRNPWRNAFDSANGDLMIADVGQSAWEEINYQPASVTTARNYGWRLKEGTSCFNPSTNCDPGGLTDPIYEYSHSIGCSITGGIVYRGSIGEIDGRYFFADYCSGNIWSFVVSGGSAVDLKDHTSELAPGGGLSIDRVVSFGEDASGEMYICDLFGGEVYKVVADSDDDGVPDIDDLCPGTIPGVSVDSDGCPPVVPGDLDRDGDVDGDDISDFVSCSSGPAIPHSGTDVCQRADIDNDNDADSDDFGLQQRCISGQDNPGDPNCDS